MYKKRVLAVFVILQVVVTSLFPVSAYADGMPNVPSVNHYWQPSDAYTIKYVNNRFDAALALIDKWSSKIQISDPMYRKLSNEGSGGDFYDLAQMLTSVAISGEPAWASPTSNFMASASFLADKAEVSRATSDWESWLWYGQVSESDISAAQRDFNIILSGGSVGGGTGIVVGNQLAPSYQQSNNGFKSGDKVYALSPSYVKSNPDTSVLAGPITIGYNIDWLENIPTDAKEWDKVWYLNPRYGVSSSYLTLTCYLCPPGSYEWETSEFTYDGQTYQRYGWLKCNSGYYKYAGYVDGSESVNGSAYDLYAADYSFDGSNLRILSGSPNLRFKWSRSSASNTINYGTGWVGGVSIGGGGDGPNNWPDPDPDPPAPDPPQNPDPDPDPPESPTFDPPGFDPPGFSPDVPVTIVPPDNTTAADYTPWLRAILTALNTIIDDMGEHCDHIRVAMRDYLNGLYEALSDDLQAYYDDLTDYMSDLAKWIVSHLNFDIKQPDVNVNVPGYDDSSVVGWLRRIYYKLRGTGSPRPDPIDDTDGALDWWTQFLQWITNALGGLLTDFVGDLGGFLQELMDTFPFSIPWDIVAMLTLLDAQRATPDVTFTIPGQNGWWDDITIRINLSAYDDSMATVRGMVLIWWMYILVMKTDWMMLLFDGANNAIGDFVSRLTGKG